MAPSNEALIKSGNKQSPVGPFRIIIHPFGTSALKENNLVVVLNVVTTSVVRPLKNRFESLENFQIHAIEAMTRDLCFRPAVSAVPLFQSICKVFEWINSLTINAYLALILEASPFPIIP